MRYSQDFRLDGDTGIINLHVGVGSRKPKRQRIRGAAFPRHYTPAFLGGTPERLPIQFGESATDGLLDRSLHPTAGGDWQSPLPYFPLSHLPAGERQVPLMAVSARVRRWVTMHTPRLGKGPSCTAGSVPPRQYAQDFTVADHSSIIRTGGAIAG